METPLWSVHRSRTTPGDLQHNLSGSTDVTSEAGSGSGGNDVPIEMDDLAASETQAWGENMSGLRHRNVRSTDHHVLEEVRYYL